MNVQASEIKTGVDPPTSVRLAREGKASEWLFMIYGISLS